MRGITHSPIGPILAAVRSVPVPHKVSAGQEPITVLPFVTISREPGAGALDVGRSFVESINADISDDAKWTCWDREIVEHVASDRHLSAQLIDGLEENNHSWMTTFLSSLSFADSAPSYDEEMVYHEVKRTIRALAEAGRAVIIGRGGVFITHEMPGGIHVRLIAPLKDRIAFIARKLGLSERSAAANIREVEKNRRVFFKTHWGAKALEPEQFALTINTAEVDVASIVQMLKTLVRQQITQLTITQRRLP